MKYVDWVERVLRATVEAFDKGNGFSTDEQEIAAQLNGNLDEIREALADALRDLNRMGLLDVRSRLDIRLFPVARKIRVASLSTTWPAFVGIWLEDRAERFLWQVVEMSVHQTEDTAFVREVEAEDVMRELGDHTARGEAEAIVRHLEQLGLADGRGATFGSTPVIPTYAGIVRVTEKVASEAQELVLRLLELRNVIAHGLGYVRPKPGPKPFSSSMTRRLAAARLNPRSYAGRVPLLDSDLDGFLAVVVTFVAWCESSKP